MRKRWKKTDAVVMVVCGTLSMWPTELMKTTPLDRSSLSSSGDMPFVMEGEFMSSSSVYSHCRSDSAMMTPGSFEVSEGKARPRPLTAFAMAASRIR